MVKIGAFLDFQMRWECLLAEEKKIFREISLQISFQEFFRGWKKILERFHLTFHFKKFSEDEKKFQKYFTSHFISRIFQRRELGSGQMETPGPTPTGMRGSPTMLTMRF